MVVGLLGGGMELDFCFRFFFFLIDVFVCFAFRALCCFRWFLGWVTD